MTKEERAAYMKKYRAEHREEIRANNRYWKAHNKDRVRETAKKCYERRKDDPKDKDELSEEDFVEVYRKGESQIKVTGHVLANGGRTSKHFYRDGGSECNR